MNEILIIVDGRDLLGVAAIIALVGTWAVLRVTRALHHIVDAIDEYGLEEEVVQ